MLVRERRDVCRRSLISDWSRPWQIRVVGRTVGDDLGALAFYGWVRPESGIATRCLGIQVAALSYGYAKQRSYQERSSGDGSGGRRIGNAGVLGECIINREVGSCTKRRDPKRHQWR